MFIAGVRHLKRTRGTGWLECPNCRERASQDVIDEMRFAALSFYRFGPIGRHRVLVCRRCNFRRPATPDEVHRLETAGEPIRTAWMVPFGFLGILAVVGLVLLVAASANQAASNGLTFSDTTGAPAIQVFYSGPVGWNYSAESKPGASDKVCGGGSPPGDAYLTIDEPGSRVILCRHVVETNLDQLYQTHFSDVASINAVGFPSEPPKSTKVKVAGNDGLMFQAKFVNAGNPSKVEFYVFTHRGVGYVLTFFSTREDEFAIIDKVRQKMLDTLKFTSDNETPAPCSTPAAATATAAAAGSPAPSASGAASPSVSASPSSGASPMPTCAPAPSPGGSGTPGASASGSPAAGSPSPSP